MLTDRYELSLRVCSTKIDLPSLTESSIQTQYEHLRGALQLCRELTESRILRKASATSIVGPYLQWRQVSSNWLQLYERRASFPCALAVQTQLALSGETVWIAHNEFLAATLIRAGMQYAYRKLKKNLAAHERLAFTPFLSEDVPRPNLTVDRMEWLRARLETYCILGKRQLQLMYRVPITLTEAEMAGVDTHFYAAHRDPQGRYVIENTPFHREHLLKHLRQPKARQKVHSCFDQKVDTANHALAKDVVKIRAFIAAISGHKNWRWMHYGPAILKTPVEEGDLLKSVRDRLKRAVSTQFNVLEKMKQADHPGSRLIASDVSYYKNRYIMKHHQVDYEELAPYFDSDTVIQRCLQFYGILFNLSFEKQTPVGSIQVFTVISLESGSLPLGTLYLNLGYSPEKDERMCCIDLQSFIEIDALPGIEPFVTQNPAAILNGSIESGPVTLKDIQGVLHEMGHAIHLLLARPSRGIREWSAFRDEHDMGEVPSQTMEFAIFNPQSLSFLLRHKETGEPLPRTTINRLIAAETVFQPLTEILQLYTSAVDSWLHCQKIDNLSDEKIAEKLLSLQRKHGIDGRGIPLTLSQISHVFRNATIGINAGLYTHYLTSRVVAAEIWYRSFHRNPFDKQHANRFLEHILRPGASVAAHDKLENYGITSPKADKFLESAGCFHADKSRDRLENQRITPGFRAHGMAARAPAPPQTAPSTPRTFRRTNQRPAWRP